MGEPAYAVVAAAGSARRAPQPVAGTIPPTDIRRLVERRLRDGRTRHLRFLLSRLRSREDAEDVAQEFALKAIQGAGRVTDADKVDAWLAVSLRNALFDRYRRNASRGRLLESARAEPAVPATPDEDLAAPLQCLADGLEDLKPETSDLLRRAELAETPLRHLADDLGITANNAGVRVHRAREALRRLMRERCAICPTPCDLAQRFLARTA